jgi:hypothetical protein
MIAFEHPLGFRPAFVTVRVDVDPEIDCRANVCRITAVLFSGQLLDELPSLGILLRGTFLLT